MGTIVDVLRHLVEHVPGLGPDNRAEAAEAVEEFGRKLTDAGVYGHDEVFPPAPAPEPAAAAAGDAGKDAEIARLKAELAGVHKQAEVQVPPAAGAQDPPAGS
jgi:hypothetical protein